MRKSMIFILMTALTLAASSCAASSAGKKENAGKAPASESSTAVTEESAVLPEKISVVYRPGDKLELTDEEDIARIMESLGKIKELMPENVSTMSFEEGGDYPGYALWTNGDSYEDIYFIYFANAKHPNLENDHIDYDIPQENIDELKGIIDDVLTEQGLSPAEALN